MKNSCCFLFFTLILSFTIRSQSWQSRQSLPSAAARAFGTAFGIGNKIYIVGGNKNYTGRDDVWEYDIPGDTWIQKASFPGGVRGGAVGFAVGGRGYLACGSNYVGQYFNDVWEYDPQADSWVQKGNFPGMPREEAAGFVIGSRAYLGTGYQEVVGPSSTFFMTFKDLWEYDPSSDTWLQKAMLPGSGRGWAIAGAAGGRGYLGLGGNSNQNGSFSDFYEYDPANDLWTQRASHPQALGDAMCFTYNSALYVCGGINFATGVGNSAVRSFDPVANLWSAQPAMSGGVSMGGVALAGSGRAFLGTGYNSSFAEKSEWWEFSSGASTLCPGPLSFSLGTQAVPLSSSCNATVVIDNINGCAPYSVSIVPVSGPAIYSVTAGSAFTITGLCPGTYSFTVNDNNCCGSSKKVYTVSAGNPAGINTVDGASQAFRVFPNPGSGRFFIKADKGELLHNIKILSSIGEEVKSRVGSLDGYQLIEIEAPVKGIYFLQAWNIAGPVNRRLVVE